MGRRGERERRGRPMHSAGGEAGGTGGMDGEANAIGGREGLVHRFAAAWVRVRAALGDG